MSTHIIISGHMRTWKTCAHTFKWHVARHLPQPFHFYISTIEDEDFESWKETKRLFPDSKVICDSVKRQPDIPEPAEPVRFEPYARSVHLQQVLRQLWQLNAAYEFYSAQGDAEPLCLVRLRPDLFFHSFSFPYLPAANEALTPWWGRFGGINDRFAILGPLAAKQYFWTYAKLDALQKMGAPLHPESLIKGSLQFGGCNVRENLFAEFSTLRKDGQMRPPEISAIDMAQAHR